jgi:hypothetical protein
MRHRAQPRLVHAVPDSVEKIIVGPYNGLVEALGVPLAMYLHAVGTMRVEVFSNEGNFGSAKGGIFNRRLTY